MNPLISVIIPTYNRAEKLNIALKSLVNQNFKNFEVIVCDDGSKDNTKDVVQSFEKLLNIQYIYNSNWGGPAYPRNQGIRYSHGSWICFLDSDDFCYPDKLEICKDYFNKADIIYHDLDSYDKNYRILRRYTAREIKKNSFEDLLYNGNALYNSAVFVKKDAIISVNLVSEDKDLISIEDYHLWLKLAYNDFKFFHVSESLGGYLEHDGNISKDVHNYASKISYLFDKAEIEFSNINILAKNCNLFHSYQIGRLLFGASEYKEAIRYFKVALKHNKILIKIKALVFLLLGYIKIAF